jgi:MATE family multidrug resistance protein
VLLTFVPTRGDLRALIKLGVPIVAGQVGIQLINVVSVVAIGHYSADDLAGATLGNLYVYGLFIFGLGMLYAMDPILAQAVGARDQHAVTMGVQRGVALAVVIGVAITVLCIPAPMVFRLLREPADVVPRAVAYVRGSMPGLVPVLLWGALRQCLQAERRTRAAVISIVGANLVNLALNWILVLGHLGAPAMGAGGSALATSASRWIMLVLILMFARRELMPRLRPWHRDVMAPGPLFRTLRIGIPIGVQTGIEYTTFATIAALAGWFGADALAGHQVALSLASLSFMVPMGLGSAAAVLVGHAIGEGDVPHARRVAASALACGAGFMAVCGAAMLAVPRAFAEAYTSVPGVAAVAITLIPIAGVFQIFDGLQVVSAGVLRGAGDTRMPMLVNVLGFWLIGLPSSLAFGFGLGHGVVGLWWGFVVALAVISTLLVTLVRVRLGGAIERVKVETGAAPTT